MAAGNCRSTGIVGTFLSVIPSLNICITSVVKLVVSRKVMALVSFEPKITRTTRFCNNDITASLHARLVMIAKMFAIEGIFPLTVVSVTVPTKDIF